MPSYTNYNRPITTCACGRQQPTQTFLFQPKGWLCFPLGWGWGEAFLLTQLSGWGQKVEKEGPLPGVLALLAGGGQAPARRGPQSRSEGSYT